MLPSSLNSITYQDIFRLLRQRESENITQRPVVPQSDKENIQNRIIKPSPIKPNNLLEQQLQNLLLLELLTKTTPNLDYRPSKLQNSSNFNFTPNIHMDESHIKSLKIPPMEPKDPKIVTKAGIPGLNRDLSSKVVQFPDSRENVILNDSFHPKGEEENDPKVSRLFDAKSKKIRKVNTCGHPERAHYAKNMCNQCYHKHGRNKKPWRCNHEKLYAHGLCQNCYINAYNKKRSLQKQREEKAETLNSEDRNLSSEVLSSPAEPQEESSKSPKEPNLDE